MIPYAADAAKTRLTLIKQIAMRTLQYLKTNSENGFKDMNDWLGARFLKEMESIDQLSEVLRHAIERGDRLREELVIKQDEFLVNEVSAGCGLLLKN